jgi:biotin carboxyl carrier protein
MGRHSVPNFVGSSAPDLGVEKAFWHPGDGHRDRPPTAGAAWLTAVGNIFNHCLAHGEPGMPRSTLKMPKVGDAVDEVVISEIQVQVGAKVAEGQTLFIVETDKTTVEIPAPFAGTVAEIRIAVGDDVKTGAPTMVLEV